MCLFNAIVMVYIFRLGLMLLYQIEICPQHKRISPSLEQFVSFLMKTQTNSQRTNFLRKKKYEDSFQTKLLRKTNYLAKLNKLKCFRIFPLFLVHFFLYLCARQHYTVRYECSMYVHHFQYRLIGISKLILFIFILA